MTALATILAACACAGAATILVRRGWLDWLLCGPSERATLSAIEEK